MTPPPPSTSLIDELRTIVGRSHVLTGRARTARFTQGYRTGGGEAALVVQPGTLVEQWRVFKACVGAGHILIVQAANTGLTGGSTPAGSYDRPVVIISTLRVRGIIPILEGRQVICLAGSTLYELERALAPFDREPHSVIGSSCIGASVVGGVCNNSGGALVQRGPAYTEYAIYAQIDADGTVSLRDHLGLRLGPDPETALRRLEASDFCDADIETSDRAASSARRYAETVRAIDEPTPARFNADPECLFEASGSAGKVMVLAVRLDTFPKPVRSKVFYIGTNDPAELTAVRRRLLKESPGLPVSGEYIHREAFDIAARYGKDTVLAIRALGTDRLPQLFRAKDWVDRIGVAIPFLPRNLADRLLQFAARVMPNHLPSRIRSFRDRFEHHLILKLADESLAFTSGLMAEIFPSQTGDVFECTPREAEFAMLHRFAVAGAAVRYRAIHAGEVEDVVALDVALRRNDEEWFEHLPADIEADVIAKLYYGHFFCHVFHQDYLVRKGVDPLALEHRMVAILDRRRAEYPAEHNVGHLYTAKPALIEHYRTLDPCNRMNPGVGKTCRSEHWHEREPGSTLQTGAVASSFRETYP